MLRLTLGFVLLLPIAAMAASHAFEARFDTPPGDRVISSGLSW